MKLKVLVLSAVLAHGPLVYAKTGSTGKNGEPFIQAEVRLEYTPGDDFPSVVSAYKSLVGNKVIVEGQLTNLQCRPLVCLESDTNCAVRDDPSLPNYYFNPEPGACCVGDDCPEENSEDQCGEQCLFPPGSCEANSDDCSSSDCFTCKKDEDGNEIYALADTRVQVDCLTTGTKYLPNGDQYNWAILCGPHTLDFFGAELQNRAIGEIDCLALRKGAGFSNAVGGIVSAGLPCQYIQLIECGCGPSDMNTFGELPEGEKPCPCREGDCPILCSDVPGASKSVCDSFPGGIEWWEGGSPFGTLFFPGGIGVPEKEPDFFEIVINEKEKTIKQCRKQEKPPKTMKGKSKRSPKSRKRVSKMRPSKAKKRMSKKSPRSLSTSP